MDTIPVPTLQSRLFVVLAVSGLMALLGACSSDASSPLTQTENPPSESNRFQTTVIEPAGLGLLDTDETDVHGDPTGVPCSTCHYDGTGLPEKHRPAELEVFHTDMNMSHGELTCQSCHAVENRDHLRLADGRELAFSEVMTLCGQCHGPQLRDYRNGAHGGMIGYWDLNQGPRERNNCVNCHDPHAPAFGQYLPVFPPRDRFLSSDDEVDH